MARQEKKFNYIYKITCNVTNRYYIGMHSTDNLNDGYFGSGKRLWFSLNYHGKENHSKDILEYCATRQDLKIREKELVTKELIGEDLCMNLKEGGDGGFSNEEHRLKFITSDGPKNFAKRVKNDKIFGNKIKETLLNNVRIAHVDGKIKYDTFTGKQHSEKTIELMRDSHKGKHDGKKNSQYNTCWITKDGLNKKVKIENLGEEIKQGWIKGRK